ncbi:ectonucleoside triphosphate diphosphohydrolase 7-like [Brevipalpus obovatus]|uniref:ectonucleoside triphosphate diphosphohydrolase 7-like n=1 Tax=Brevipalpus obovatus TaxID=246614 RepID=UPI003D9F1B57
MASYHLVSSRYNYFKLAQRLFFTGKIRFTIILILIGFLLVYLLRALQSDDEFDINVDSYEFQDKLSSTQSSFYAVMIDAGSSGSRVHLYTWPPYSGENRGLIKVKMMKDAKGQDLQKKITPGLSSQSITPENAFNYIYPLLKFAAQNIPVQRHKETPLYILATAGMRLLSLESQKAILDNLRENIKSNSSFLFAPSNVQVITGKEEGIYSWISINYLLGRYDHSVAPKPLVAINLENGITTRPRTVGMLEMGGASVQIAFEITSKYELEEIRRRRGAATREDLKDVLAQFDLGCNNHDSDHKYLVYVTTFLGLGANVAKEAYLKFLIEQQKRIQPPIIERIPQLNISTANNDSSSPILPPPPLIPKTLSLSDPCLCRNCPLNVSVTGVDGVQYNLALVGLGNFDHCEATLRKLINPTQERSVLCKFNVSCPIKELANTRISFTDAEFYGFSELWYSMEDVLRIGGHYNYFSFKKAASDYCSTEFKILKERLGKNLYPNADERRLIEECFKAAWITTVLHVGFKMPKDFKNYQSALAINNNQVQWTLGALLYRVRPPSPHVIDKEIQSQRAVVSDLKSFHNILFLLCMLIVLVVIAIYLKHLNQMIYRDQTIELDRKYDLVSSTDRSSDTVLLIERGTGRINDF